MPESFTVPQTSPEVKSQVYGEFLDSMPRFVVQTASQLEKDQPTFLDANLTGAINIALTEHHAPATMMLAGSFFRFECARRELQLRGARLPLIGIKTFTDSLHYFRELRDLTTQIGVTDVMLRRMAIQLSNEDPIVGQFVTKLLELPLEVQRGQYMDVLYKEFIKHM